MDIARAFFLVGYIEAWGQGINKISAPKICKSKRVALKDLTGTVSWQVRSENDVDQYLAALRASMIEELKDNTVLNIEF